VGRSSPHAGHRTDKLFHNAGEVFYICPRRDEWRQKGKAVRNGNNTRGCTSGDYRLHDAELRWMIDCERRRAAERKFNWGQAAEQTLAVHQEVKSYSAARAVVLQSGMTRSDCLRRSGGAGGIRTPYLLNAIQALSQLSYSPTAISAP
jgi:hypothetical protein